MKFRWPLFLALKFTFFFLNLAKIQISIPKSVFGWGESAGLGIVPKKHFFTTSLIGLLLFFFHVQAGPWQAVGLVNGGRLMVHFVRFRVGSLFNNVGLNHHQLTNMQQALYCFLSFLLFHQQISGMCVQIFVFRGHG